MTTSERFVLKIVLVLIVIATILVWRIPWRKHLDEATIQAMIENAKLRSEIATLEAESEVMDKALNCQNIKEQLGLIPFGD